MKGMLFIALFLENNVRKEKCKKNIDKLRSGGGIMKMQLDNVVI